MTYKSGVVEYRCDSCGKVLVGYDHNILVNADYLCFKGTLTLQLFDSEIKKRYFVHVIPKERGMITICNQKCLEIYIKFQHSQYMKERELRLRNTASRTHTQAPTFHKKY